MKVNRFVAPLLAVAMVAVMASSTFAQQPGGRQRGGGQGVGGRGGFGGFGGFGGGGGGDMTFGLLRLEPVQVELEIAPEQKEALTKLEEQSRGERPERGSFPNFREMSEEERREFFEKRMKEQSERTAKMKEQLEEVLFPEQMERLEQISLQLRGVAALTDEKVAGELKITSAQKEKMAKVQEEQRETLGAKMRELFTGGDRENMREAISGMREDMENAVLGVLTSDQKKKFEEMKGEKFEMPEGAGRGGRGGFGGGGRGGFGGGQGGFGGGRGGEGGGRGGRGGEGGGRGGRGGRGGEGGRGGRPPVEE